MRESTLLSPGVVTAGMSLRRSAAQAISQIEIVAARTPGGKTLAAAQLSAFFTDAASKLSGLIDSVVPTIAGTTTTRTSATTFTMVFAEDMAAVVPPTSSITIPSRTVTTLAWTAVNTLTITVASGATAGDVVTYTQPTNGSPKLQDVAGNLVATGNKTSV